MAKFEQSTCGALKRCSSAERASRDVRAVCGPDWVSTFVWLGSRGVDAATEARRGVGQKAGYPPSTGQGEPMTAQLAFLRRRECGGLLVQRRNLSTVAPCQPELRKSGPL